MDSKFHALLEKLGIIKENDNLDITPINVMYDKIELKLTMQVAVNEFLSYSFYDEICTKLKEHFKVKSISMFVQYEGINLDSSKLDDLIKEYVPKAIEDLDNPDFVVLLASKMNVEDRNVYFYVSKENEVLNEQVNSIETSLKKYGFKTNVHVLVDENIKTAEEIIKQKFLEDEKEFKNNLEQAKIKNADKTAETVVKSAYKASYKELDVTPICKIPQTQSDIDEYEHLVGPTVFVIKGVLFDLEVRELKNTTLATLKVTDGTDSIIVKRFLKKEEDIKRFKELKINTMLKIRGRAAYDTYIHDVSLMADDIKDLGIIQQEIKKDNAEVKRVELHLHTKMSNLDGVTEPVDFLNRAISYGHKAIAFTDHDGVYSIPDVDHALKDMKKKGKSIKPLYGLESSFLRDDAFKITLLDGDFDLRKAIYTVFDIETTGFSVEHDKIIQIAALKVDCSGSIIDRFETLVNPLRPIGQISSDLTKITDEMVSSSPTIEEVLPKFKEFIDGTVLVAHNATFDIGHIYYNMRLQGIFDKPYYAIDTLMIARNFYYNDLKKFNLEACAKFFKVKQEQHHSAIDDTKVLEEIFISMLSNLFKNGHFFYGELNSLIDKNQLWKTVIPNHINVLVKNQVGYKNLFKLTSDILTTHFNNCPRILKSTLDFYRDGLLVGSGCYDGEIFETALNKPYEDLLPLIDYYDYIEVQPKEAYNHFISTIYKGDEAIEYTIKKIIKAAKERGKIVVATGDVHYLDREEKKFRDILIQSPLIGGGVHALKKYGTNTPMVNFKTTDEMLLDFDFLGRDLAYEIVVTNTNKIADMVEDIQAFHPEMFAPADDEFKDSLGVPSIKEEVRNIVYNNLASLYGDNPHPYIKHRIDHELECIINNGYSSVYYLSYLLVKKSNDDGYLVGSRGSVGSSLVATMMHITEINSLPPHYYCKNCHFVSFKMTDAEKKEYPPTEEQEILFSDLENVRSGYDLPERNCPICGEKLFADGHDIPFETFLGFDGDKVPDIDLNFSGDYQPIAHEYVRTLMDENHAFRSGTVSTIADKQGYGYVKAYTEKNNVFLRGTEIDRISQKLLGVKRSTGQHPGGIIVVPHRIDIFDITPIQYPADNTENNWNTTHFDYHQFENNLLKLDILGHDDPTVIKFIMKYVNNHQELFPFSDAKDIPVNDPKIFRLFNSTDVIGVSERDLGCKVASYGIPEFGTSFVRGMLEDTMPKNFAELVKISGLSHGTDVWLKNAQDLVLGKTEHGFIPFKDIIGCRDDIMVYLLGCNLAPLKAFEIMEFVRRGKPAKHANDEKWDEYKNYMRDKNVPEWFIWSCEKIQYMFPKAHATAYVLMAIRIAYFKVYYPPLFYSAFFSIRASQFAVEELVLGPVAIKNKLEELMLLPKTTVKEDDLITSLGVALEMTLRGIKFLPIDILKSEATEFKIEDGNLRIPFVALDGLGKVAAIDIVEKRNEKPFTSKDDVLNRTKMTKTHFENLNAMGAFDSLSDACDVDDIEEKKNDDDDFGEGLFSFLN